eukprot:scaffold118773_cov28-Tisochrysis_lutea.AAC.2
MEWCHSKLVMHALESLISPFRVVRLRLRAEAAHHRHLLSVRFDDDRSTSISGVASATVASDRHDSPSPRFRILTFIVLWGVFHSFFEPINNPVPTPATPCSPLGLLR